MHPSTMLTMCLNHMFDTLQEKFQVCIYVNIFLDLACNTGNIMMHLVMLLELVEIHLRDGHSATAVALL